MVRFEPGTFHSASERLNHSAIPETVKLDDTEQQELKDRVEAKARQQQEKKAKAKKKGKKQVEQPEIIEVENPEQSEDIQIPPPTVTMPNRNNRNGRNGDDGDVDRQDERNHYWSLRDIPKFEGKGEQPYSHLMEFEDYLVA